MPFTVTMPKLSPTMEEGSIAKWHKKEGELIRAGELLVEINTDKATVEYNALDGGYLRKILAPVGKMVAINQPIAVCTVTLQESVDGYQPEGVGPAPVAKTEKISSKNSSVTPIVPQGTTMQQPAFIPEAPLEQYSFPFSTGKSDKRIAASPLAKKIAEEKGLDLSSVQGSGPGGRITSRDVPLAQADQTVRFGRSKAPEAKAGSYEEVPLSPLRKVIATRLQQAKSFIPHFYLRQEIDAEPLIQLREQLKNGEVKITINDLMVRAAALALKEHPGINSGFHSVNQSIVLFQTIDIAVGVSVEGGIVTPIIRYADYKNVGEISAEIKELAARAKAGKLEPHEYKGGSFTISNLGMFGISEFMAIINPPQAAILAVAGIEECIRWRNDAAIPGKKMSLTLAADHRVVDGTDGARFLKDVQKFLENPALLVV